MPRLITSLAYSFVHTPIREICLCGLRVCRVENEPRGAIRLRASSRCTCGTRNGGVLPVAATNFGYCRNTSWRILGRARIVGLHYFSILNGQLINNDDVENKSQTNYKNRVKLKNNEFNKILVT